MVDSGQPKGPSTVNKFMSSLISMLIHSAVMRWLMLLGFFGGLSITPLQSWGQIKVASYIIKFKQTLDVVVCPEQMGLDEYTESVKRLRISDYQEIEITINLQLFYQFFLRNSRFFLFQLCSVLFDPVVLGKCSACLMLNTALGGNVNELMEMKSSACLFANEFWKKTAAVPCNKGFL